jgi:hypothetical protein
MRSIFVATAVAALLLARSATGQDTTQPPFKPIASVKDVMRAMVVPTSNVVFRVEVEPPQDDIGWEKVRLNALAMAEAGNLLMVPGRAKNSDDWMKKSAALVDIGVAAAKAAEAKDPGAVVRIGYEIYDVCAGCHDFYMPSRVLRRQQQQQQQRQQQP